MLFLDAGDDADSCGREIVVTMPGGRRGYTGVANKGSRARRSRPAAAAAEAGQDNRAAHPNNPQPPERDSPFDHINP